jgi:hypothetical protein
MKKESFRDLLTDLYAAYNPDFIKYIPQLVEKYHRLEFDAVQNILIKYNHDSYVHYDPLKATDEYIHQLIRDYDSGVPSLKDFTIEMHIKRKQEEQDNKNQEELSNTKKQLDEIKEKIDNAKPSVQRVSIYDDVEISIKSNYTESELILPNKEVLAGLGKGTRLIVSDRQGKMVGLIVEEILYDCISHPLGMPIVEIVISKG